MKNLAGDRDCDKVMLEEMKEAGIHPVKVDRMNSEVPSSYIGVLNGFKFMRAWYYWVVTGEMPLDDAISIYESFGVECKVRTAGMAGNDDPRKWAKNKDYDEEMKPYMEKYKNGELDFSEVSKISNEVSSNGEQIIDVYHVDLQIGLNKL